LLFLIGRSKRNFENPISESNFKTNFSNKKNEVMKTRMDLKILGIMIFSVLFLWACPNQQERRAEQEFEEAQDEMEETLVDLRDEIDARLDELEDAIEDAEGDAEESLEDARAELREQRDAVERELENVRGASRETWAQVEAQASQTANQVRNRTLEIYRDVEAWVEDIWAGLENQ
jgi:DNA anti-recombination protein RmuC